MRSKLRSSTLTLPQRVKLSVFVAVCLVVFERVSSAGQQLPPDWSQHFHDGKVYYYDSRTGTTQWEPPIVPTQTDLHNEKAYHDDQLATPSRNVDDQEFLQQISTDPWASVNIDDDFDPVTSGPNDDRRFRVENNNEYSDDENWYDDESRHQQHAQTATAKSSKVSRTFNDFKTSFSSLKSMLKVKARKKKLELFGSPAESQQNRRIDENYRDDFTSPAQRYKGQDVQNSADVQDRDPQQQQQQQQHEHRAVQADLLNRDQVQEDLNFNRQSDLQPSTRKFQEKQQEKHQLNDKDMGVSRQRQSNATGSGQQINASATRRQPLSDGASHKNTVSKDQTDRENDYDIEEKKLKREAQATEERAYAPPSEKISVRLMGKADANLWADYVDEDDASSSKKKNTHSDRFGASENDNSSSRSLASFQSLVTFKGLGNMVGSVFGSLISVIPLGTRMALSMLLITVSSAPLQVLLLMTLTVLQDLLLPLGLLCLVSTVQYVQDLSLPIPSATPSNADHSPSIDSLSRDSPQGTRDSASSHHIIEHSPIVLEDVKEGKGAVVESDVSALPVSMRDSQSNSYFKDYSRAEEYSMNMAESSVSSEGGIDASLGVGVGMGKSGGIGIGIDDRSDTSIGAARESIFISKGSGTGARSAVNRFEEFSFADLNIPSPKSYSAGEGDQNIHQNVFNGDGFTFSGLLIALERVVRSMLRDLKETLRLAENHLGPPALITILTVSVILSGILLPSLKLSIGDNIVNFIKKKKRDALPESIGDNQYEGGQQREDVSADRVLFADDDDDDDDDVYEENAGMKSAIVSKLMKLKKQLFRRKRKGRSSLSFQGLRAAERGGGIGSSSSSSSGSGSGTREVGARGQNGQAERALSEWEEELSKLSRNVLRSPVDVLVCAVEGYLTSLYLVLTLFFISLLSVDRDLKIALSLPYGAVLLLSTIEPYINRLNPQRSVHPSQTDRRALQSLRNEKDESSRLAYLNRILQNRRSIEELKKWNLLEHVENIKVAEEVRVNSVESAQIQLQVSQSRGSGRLAVDSESRWSTFLLSGRMMVGTIVVAVLSVRPVLHIIETYVKGQGQGRAELNIFSRIAVMDIPTVTQNTLAPLQSSEIYNSFLAAASSLLASIREILHQIHEFLSGYGMGDFEYPSFLPNFQSYELNLVKAQLEWQKRVSTLWVPQMMALGALTLGPLLLWHRVMASSSKAVCAAGDVVAVGHALDDAHFKAALPLLFHRQGDGLPHNGASYRSENSDAYGDLHGDGDRGGGWTVDGPNKELGVQIKDLSLAKGKKASMKGVTVTFPARSITVILSAKSPSAPASKSIQSDVLQAIYGSLSSPLLSHVLGAADSMTAGGTGAGAGTDHDRVQVGGSVWVHGRELSEWSLKALRERITFMKDGELDLSLPAGMLAGTHMLDGSNGFKESKLQEVTNLNDFYSSLPFGAATVVGSKTEGEGYTLSSGERRSLSLSRALRSLHRDIILLEGPCDQLSEAQERSFFQLLRAEVGSSGTSEGLEGKGKGKVVIITASRFATALHADRVIVMMDGRVGQEGTHKELISQPGPFRDQLFPPAL